MSFKEAVSSQMTEFASAPRDLENENRREEIPRGGLFISVAQRGGDKGHEQGVRAVRA